MEFSEEEQSRLKSEFKSTLLEAAQVNLLRWIGDDTTPSHLVSLLRDNKGAQALYIVGFTEGVSWMIENLDKYQ